jgi:hypothetical protein
MSRILFRRITIAAALAALLTLAVPAQAAGWNGWAPGGDLLQSAWQWVAGLWAPVAPAHHSGRITKTDRGSSIDPDGAQARSDQGSGLDPMGTKSDRSSSIDPDGRTTSSSAPCQVGCQPSGGVIPNG